MSASDVMTSAMTPVLRPYLPATRDFAAGKDSPRDFLERCLAALDAWEPRIGAFVTLNVEAARADADRSSARWRAGNPLSPIDGMPLGIKDIIETADMPTENGSPLFAGLPQRARRRERRRAARGRRRDHRQDRDHRVRRDRAARHPQSVGPRPHAGRVEQRLGGRGRRRRHSGRARHPGDRLDAASGELLRLLRLQADDRRDQPRRQLRRAEPELHRDARREPRGGVAGRLRDREARRRRPRLSRPLRPAASAGADQAAPTRASRNRRLGRGFARCAAGARGSAVPPDAGRHRHRDALRSCRDRCSRNRDPRRPRTLLRHQCLGIAVADQHLQPPRCVEALPGDARPPGAGGRR